MSVAVVKKILKDLKGVGMMATVDGAQPRVRPMACTVDGKTLWISTFAKSPKMKQIAKNPSVEFCFMDQKMNHVRMSGKVKVVTSAKTKAAVWKKSPDLKVYFQTVDNPMFVLLEFKPAKVLLMAGSMKYETVKL